MSEEDQANQTAAADAERRAKALEDLGLEDPYDGWTDIKPIRLFALPSHIPQRISQGIGSCSPNEGPDFKETAQSKPNSGSNRMEGSEQASIVTFRLANACGNATRHPPELSRAIPRAG